MGKILSPNEMHLPEPKSLPGCPSDTLPFHLLRDEIIPLKTWLMRPYPCKMLQEDQSVYNNRHSRPRPLISDTFGTLMAR